MLRLPASVVAATAVATGLFLTLAAGPAAAAAASAPAAAASAPEAAAASEPASAPAHATCDDLKASIAAKLDGKKVAGYTLDIVDADKAGDLRTGDPASADGKVVAVCGGGTKKIVYKRQ